ncbi:hypothetical protein [Paenibacillus tyrfis]|nr:hypothetical protein [Paenibacillus tyrfis]
MKAKVRVMQYLTPKQRSEFYGKKNSRLAGRLRNKIKNLFGSILS